MSVGVGDIAPLFSLKNQNDEAVRLTDFAGKRVVLYFYPKALTPGCTTQACGLRDVQDELNALDAVVLGVSPDPVNRLQKFIDKHNLNFQLLADEDHQLAEQYGVWRKKQFMGKEFMGVVRTTFIIDADGKVAEVMDKVKTKTHHQAVIDWLTRHSE